MKQPLQMNDDVLNGLLRRVSRSFYLSIRILPLEMRRAVALGYLLARATDTLADELPLSGTERLRWLERIDRCMRFNQSIESHDWKGCLIGLKEEEAALLRELPVLERELGKLSFGEAELVREVVGTICSGQRMDLERFDGQGACVALKSEEELWDYTWRVAGCVGEFWTKLGRLTLGCGFSEMGEEELLGLGRRFGQGLQLVNILRDVSEDLCRGRCYLPVEDPHDEVALRACHRHWCGICRGLLQDGMIYAAAMGGRRLRVAVELPALIGLETLALLGEGMWEHPLQRRKIPRGRVRWLALKSCLGVAWPC